MNKKIIADTTLQKTSENITRFIKLITHDVNGAAQNINGFTSIIDTFISKLKEENPQIINKYPQGLDDITAALNFIYQATNNITTVFAKLKEFNKFEAETLSKKFITIQECLVFSTIELQPEIRKRNVKINCPEAAKIYSDKFFIEHILHNLISNAIKYTPPERDPIITIGVEMRDTHNILSVSDNGYGIDKSKLKLIFDFGIRLHQKPETPGTGDGLGFVKFLTEKQGGKCWAESEKDIGSTFYISLPNI